MAAFGAFVDIGVHQDGLVHVSAMSNSFVSDPHTVVKSGQVVRVKVLEVEPERKRISLTLRLDDEAGAKKADDGARGNARTSPRERAGKPAAGSGESRRSGTPVVERVETRRPGQDGSRQARSPKAAAPANTAMAEALRRAGLGG